VILVVLVFVFLRKKKKIIMCEHTKFMNTLKLLTLDSSDNKTCDPSCLTLSQTLVLLPKLLTVMEPVKTLEYTCNCCKREFTMLHPRTKLNKTLLKTLQRYGLDSSFVKSCKNLKTCILPAFGYKDFSKDDVYTFYTYNVLNSIVGTPLEPHQDITMCRSCMIDQFNKEVEDLPLEGTLSPSSTLMYRHLKDYKGKIQILPNREYREYIA
jgi:hypothetical protein